MATTTQAHSSDGQNHERFDGPQHADAAVPLGEPPEITVLQRMLSATTGSLLTGLLVTPLDVVRVRLQSQTVTPPVIDFEKLPANFQKIVTTSPGAFRATDLGVTACCREVFFMNAHRELCLAGPKVVGAGAAAGAAADAASAATSTAASSAAARGAAAFPDCAVEQHQQKTIHSTMDGLRKIARNEGALTLWRGLSPTLLMSIPANVIYFTGYEWLRHNEASPIRQATADSYVPLTAGAAARVLAATAVSPIELFRTRLQASSGESAAGHLQDTFQDLRGMVAAHGYRSLWRGLTLTLWRDVPFSGMYWWGYEAVRGQLTEARERRRQRQLGRGRGRGRGRSSRPLLDDHLDGAARRAQRRRSQSRENHTETFLDSFAAGSLSGAAASIATMPFDVGKTRTQVFREVRAAGPPATAAALATVAAPAAAAVPEEQNMGRLLWHIFRTEGVAGLFRGWIPRTLKVAPACAIMISSYEVGKKVFRGINERAQSKREGV